MNNTDLEKLKKAAIEIWETYDDTHGYASSKIEVVNKIEIPEAYMIINMFDWMNQKRLKNKIGNLLWQKSVDSLNFNND